MIDQETKELLEIATYLIIIGEALIKISAYISKHKKTKQKRSRSRKQRKRKKK